MTAVIRHGGAKGSKSMPKRYTLVVLTNAVEGKDREFNDWYSGRHLQDVLAIPGFKSAQRHKLVAEPMANAVRYGYFAAYDIETDDPQGALEELARRAGTDRMPMSEAMDASSFYAVLYEAITPVVTLNRK
jgi:hypothetical protein